MSSGGQEGATTYSSRKKKAKSTLVWEAMIPLPTGGYSGKINQ